MNNYLYIDTSDHLIIGLLDPSLEFLELVELPETKSSGIIHKTIHKTLQQYQISPLKLKGIIQAAGPGSYTGMRLSHGIVQIFQWQGVEYYGFYHFEVPLLFGAQEGCWVAKAFKGEIFNYHWKGEKNDFSLLPEADFLTLYDDGQITGSKNFYTHFPEKLNQKMAGINSTHQMIKDRPSHFFRRIIDDEIKKGPYYFRTLEKEFKRPEPPTLPKRLKSK